jgi:hypothetical protein
MRSILRKIGLSNNEACPTPSPCIVRLINTRTVRINSDLKNSLSRFPRNLGGETIYTLQATGKILQGERKDDEASLQCSLSFSLPSLLAEGG